MNELKTFTNSKLGAVRTLDVNGEPWFVAADVCRVLGILNPTDTMKRLDDDEKEKFDLGLPGGDVNCINESGLYTLILGSRKPEARALKRWIAHNVVPAMYVTPPSVGKLEQILSDPGTMVTVLKAYKDEHEQRMVLEAQIECWKPFIDFAKEIAANSDAILIDEFVTLADNSGIEIDCEFLLRWLRDNGYFTQNNQPQQRYVDQGIFVVGKSSVTTVLGEMTQHTTLVTGEGQIVLLDALQHTFTVAG